MTATTATPPTTIATTNPATGARLAEYTAMTAEELDTAVQRASDTQADWARHDLADRCAVLTRAAATLRERAEELAQLVVAEMGKPVTEARGEVEKCAWVCDYYAEQAPEILAEEVVEAAGSRSFTSYEPVGTVLAVMPWNFPLWQVFRFAAPALVAGNAALLKHAPNVTGTALAVQEVLGAAGLPDGLFTTLLVAEADVPDVVAGLVADPRVHAVTLTGSNRAGAGVAAAAGTNIKKTVLELGGSDPFVVLDDADLDVVVPKAVTARFINSGQSCLAAKRFIVHRSIADEFAQRLAEAAAALVVGDPTAETTQVGPLARPDLADALDAQVRQSVADGARVLTGGTAHPNGPGWYQPTVLADVRTDMAVMSQETFGPAAAVIAFDTDDEAVALANATEYGLGASVWATDVDHALRVGRRIQSGALFVNAVVASDPRLPFGGVKQSGYGRELGTAGAREFTNLRTTVIA